MEKKEITIVLSGSLLERYEHERTIWSSIKKRKIKDGEFVEDLLREYFYTLDHQSAEN